jgi:hypothetical protein
MLIIANNYKGNLSCFLWNYALQVTVEAFKCIFAQKKMRRRKYGVAHVENLRANLFRGVGFTL